MKRILNNIGGIFLTCIVAFSSCKKDDGEKLYAADTFTATDFQYNLATKKFAPQVELNGNIKSEAGIELVYFYLVRGDGQPVLVHTDEPTVESRSDYNFTIPNAAFSKLNMDNAQGLKIMVRHENNTSSEGFVKIAPFTPEKPAFLGIPNSVTPPASGPVAIAGQVKAESGLTKVDIYDNYLGDFALVGTINGLNDVVTYNLNYNYQPRAWASKIKLVATDATGVPGEKIIDLNVTYPVNVFFNVNMNAHGVGTNTIFFEKTGSTADNCALNASEATMAFLYYGTSSGPAFYSPTNTANVARNFKCNGADWVIQNSGALRATRFRVLVRGSSAGVDNIYNQYENSQITSIDDAYFTANAVAAPSSSSVRFDAAAPASASIFNLTNAYLIYARIPDVGSPTTFKNALIRVKEATSSGATSSVKFDIVVQK